jgi:DNA-binding transcriptional regulator GbsR (MarR family)
MDNLENEKQKLIEMFGIHFETHHNLPPLSSRILGTLILNCRIKGLTFEELVEVTGASKSSISTNINLLLKLEKINYYTLPGDRRKHFRPSNLADRIQNHLKILHSEIEIVNKVKAFDEKYRISADYEKGRSVLSVYLEYVHNFEKLLQDSIKKINQLEQQ